MIFKRQKKLRRIFVYNEVIPDNSIKQYRKEIEDNIKIKRALIKISGHSDYPDDLCFVLYKDGKIVDHFRLLGFDWAFTKEWDLTEALKNESSKGIWVLEIRDCAEEDIAYINFITLFIIGY